MRATIGVSVALGLAALLMVAATTTEGTALVCFGLVCGIVGAMLIDRDGKRGAS